MGRCIQGCVVGGMMGLVDGMMGGGCNDGVGWMGGWNDGVGWMGGWNDGWVGG